MKKNILIIGNVWPEPCSTAAGTRMLQLIELFQKNDYTVTFASASSKNDKSFPLENLGIVNVKIQLNNSNFDTFIKKLNPHIVLFDRFLTEEQYGWRVSENCPDALRILDTEDLHFLRHARHKAHKYDDEVSIKYLINDITKREIASIFRCDLSLIISKYEYELLINTFKIDSSLLIYVPFLLDQLDIETINSYPAFSERKNFMTIGNFIHEPNWNAILHLKNTIWPLIKLKLPNAQMHIYGAYATEKVMQLHNKKDDFYIKGWTNDAKEAFTAHKICLAPLLFGAGLKGKLIDAMLYGTPSVTTKIGAEAMHDKLDWNGFIIDTPEEFANKAVELYDNEKTWKTAQKNGIEIVNNCYSKEKFTELMMNRINRLFKNIENHRLENFTGAMLMHHSLKSTKYLSKWIEEKEIKKTPLI